jgi:signal transduction histidine kinase
MTTTDLVDRLTAHRTIGSVARDELAWLASRGSIRQMQTGDVLTSKGSKPDGLFVVLSGRIAIFVDRGTGPHKVMEWREGDVTGFLPYSRITGPPADTVAQELTTILCIPRDDLRDMIRECHEITSILVHSMIDRVREFKGSELHDEKMISLGKLSAGLAHELNNPASAIERSAVILERALDDAEQATWTLGAARLTGEQLSAVQGVRTACVAADVRGVASPLAQADREEAISDWLAAHSLDNSLADALAETPVTIDALDRVAAGIDGPTLDAVLRWASAGCSVRRLASEIHEAATRISGLVMAIKGFTHMDQAAVAEPVDLIQGLSNTVAVLRSKARGKAATVAVDAEDDLHVRGFAGELNQIWANLIDNALDAIADGGRVDILANRDGRRVIVRIVDNGSGIPDQIKGRIFDPFVTTKPVGQGTGLGLDIVRRLVRHNDGEITVDSQPGRTEFRVVVPAVAADGIGAEA